MRNLFESTIHNGNNLGHVKKPKQLTNTGVKALLQRAATSQKVFPELKEGEKRREWALSHGLRKYFKTKAEEKMKSIHVERLMGHNIGVAMSYMRATEKELLNEYVKAVDLLTFEEVNKKMEEIKKEVKN